MIDETVFLKPGDVLGGLRLEGFSRAGVGTSLWMPSLGICFDVGPGVQEQAVCSKFFITHAHLDHAAGIPYVLSQRTLQGLFEHEVFAREPLIACYKEVLQAWSRVEEFDYRAKLTVFEDGVVCVHPGYEVIRFPTVHRIPSQGYTLRHRKKKLKPEFERLGQAEIRDLRIRGIEVAEDVVTSVLSFTGDTQIEVLDLSPEIAESKILFLEVSYYGSKKSVQEARRWGHIHLDELQSRWDQLKCDFIVLKHTSRRYSRSEVLVALNEIVPPAWVQKVRVWGM